MKDSRHRKSLWAGLLAVSLTLCGCASIGVNTKEYLTSPRYAPTDLARVGILSTEPKQPHETLGEIMLTIQGNPSREKVEQKLKAAAAKLGADAVFVRYDTTHVIPVLYYDWWGGPYATSQAVYRSIVAVAIKYK